MNAFEKTAGAGGEGDISNRINITDEWKEARNVINNCDSQVSDIRKYGLSFVSGLLAAQGLIEFPLKSASQVVPDSVKLSILIASYLLIVGIFDLDRKARNTQRAAAHRACMLEGRSGLQLGLTQLISKSYGSEAAVTSADVLYLVFVGATTILGLAVLGITSLTPSFDLVVLLVFAGGTAAVVYLFGHTNRLRRFL
ncbi:MAG: hypothetical protein L3K23_06590 [Thermoplasmata archaeon]|nr:hypothetical protein [Thermoplasmata archaeon]